LQALDRAGRGKAATASQAETEIAVLPELGILLRDKFADESNSYPLF
jgi:hypothetical protein